MVPAYTLSTYVLGVRRDAPIVAKCIVIQPHLGDLSRAEGIVVTEFGPVPVSWKVVDGTLAFAFTVPVGVKAAVFLPAGPFGTVAINGRPVATRGRGRWRTLELGPGSHEGTSR
jgi:hypothetical protein